MDESKPNQPSEKKEPGIELLDFWAEWCGPCKVMEPIFNEIEKEYGEKIKITKINVDQDEHRDLVERYNVMSIPTYLFKRDGEVVEQLIGAQSKETITKKIDALL